MKINEFITKWNGKGIDFDGYYGDQCMDLMHQYCVEVLGLIDGRVLAQPDAKSVYINFKNVFGKEYFTQISNTPTGIPIAGDIILWGFAPYGHVAIFVEGNIDGFTSFDQNYPVGSKCHLQKHTYKDVLGCLRPIKLATGGTTESDKDKKIADLEKEKDKFEILSIKQAKTIKVMENDLKELENKLEDLQKERDVFHDISERTSEEVKELKTSVADALKKAEDWEADYIELETQLTKTNNLYNKQVGDIERMTAEISILQSANRTMYENSTNNLNKFTTGYLVGEISNRVIHRLSTLFKERKKGVK